MSYVACWLFIVFLKRHTKPVYDNNCSREQTHTSCTVCLFALELSSVKTFSCTCKITSSVWISRSLLSRLPELRNERKSWKCNISPAIFFFLFFFHPEGEQEEAWLTEAGLAQMVDNSLAPNLDEVSVICHLFQQMDCSQLHICIWNLLTEVCVRLINRKRTTGCSCPHWPGVRRQQ